MSEGEAARLAALFAGSSRGYGTHGEPIQQIGGLKWEIKKTARTLRGAVTKEMWLAHIEGKTPLGIIPIRDDNKCLWGSIDVDEYEINLTDLIEKVEGMKFPLVPCRSKSGGLHLFLFLQDWTPANVIAPTLRHLAAQLGLGAHTEIFPKQMSLVDDKDLGNWIIAPYYGSDYDGRLKTQVGLRRDQTEMTLTEFLDVAENGRVDAAKMAGLRAPRARAQASGQKAAGNGAGDPFFDGPPCLQHLVAGKLLGDGRKRALTHMAVYYKRKRPSDWTEALHEANRNFLNPPHDPDTVNGIIKSYEKKDYNYLCKEEPMVSHCDSLTCRARKYGVGAGGVPAILALSMYDIEPPVWFVDLEAGRIAVTTEELLDLRQFNTKCVKVLHVGFSNISQKDWSTLTTAAIANHVKVPPPPDVDLKSILMEYLNEFFTNRAVGERPQDLRSGRPYHDQKKLRYCARLQDIYKFLKRAGAPKEISDSRIWIGRKIEELGGGHDTIQGVRIYYVPEALIEVAPEMEIPKPRSSPI